MNTPPESSSLATEMRTYGARRCELEKLYFGKFIVIKGTEVVGAWDTLAAAAEEAVRRFGRGPYLIRQVGAPPAMLPASVLFRPAGNAADAHC